MFQERKAVVYAVIGTTIGCVAYLAAPPASRGPILFLDAAAFEIETLWAGRTVSGVFNVRNNGDLPLQIESILSTCGCTATAISRRNVPPGEHAVLRIDVTGRHGMEAGQVAKVAIASNDRLHPIVVVPVVIREMAGFSVVPGLLDFGVLLRKELPATRRFYIVDSGRRTYAPKVLSLRVDTPTNWITVKEQQLDKSRGEWTVDLELRASAPCEQIATEIYVSLRDDAGVPCFAQPVSLVAIVKERGEVKTRSDDRR